MDRVSTLTAPSLEEFAFSTDAQQGVKQQLFRTPGEQACPKLAQHGMVKARISQFQIQRLFPIDPAAHRIGGLAIR